MWFVLFLFGLVSVWGGGVGFGLCLYQFKHCMFIGNLLFLLCLSYALHFEFNDLIIEFSSWILGQNFALGIACTAWPEVLNKGIVEI